MHLYDVSGQFLFNPPKFWQRHLCRKNINHWPLLRGDNAGKCRWCGRGDLQLDSQGNHYIAERADPKARPQ